MSNRESVMVTQSAPGAVAREGLQGEESRGGVRSVSWAVPSTEAFDFAPQTRIRNVSSLRPPGLGMPRQVLLPDNFSDPEIIVTRIPTVHTYSCDSEATSLDFVSNIPSTYTFSNGSERAVSRIPTEHPKSKRSLINLEAELSLPQRHAPKTSVNSVSSSRRNSAGPCLGTTSKTSVASIPSSRRTSVSAVSSYTRRRLMDIPGTPDFCYTWQPVSDVPDFMPFDSSMDDAEETDEGRPMQSLKAEKFRPEAITPKVSRVDSSHQPRQAMTTRMSRVDSSHPSTPLASPSFGYPPGQHSQLPMYHSRSIQTPQQGLPTSPLLESNLFPQAIFPGAQGFWPQPMSPFGYFQPPMMSPFLMPYAQPLIPPPMIHQQPLILPPQTSQGSAITTLMLRNIPVTFGREMVISDMHVRGFAGCYDFFYLPMDFQSGNNLGYAFINFVSQAEAERFRFSYDGLSLAADRSKKVCAVAPATTQGMLANVEYYRNSPVMSMPIEFHPLLLQNGVRLPFPPPTKVIKELKPRMRKDQ